LKGTILTLTVIAGTTFNWQKRAQFDARLNTLVAWNLSAVSVTVQFDESSINPVQIPASTSLSLTPFDLYQENIMRLDFGATTVGASPAPQVNLIWNEGPSFLVIGGAKRS
jgi:hypothetical protein